MKHKNCSHIQNVLINFFTTKQFCTRWLVFPNNNNCRHCITNLPRDVLRTVVIQKIKLDEGKK